MLWQAVWVLCGVLLRLVLQPPLPLWVTGLSGLLAAAGLCLRPVRLLGCGLLGFAVAQAALYAHGAAVQRVDERLLVQARIVSIAQVSGLATRFDAQLQFPRDPQRPGLRARISWPGAGGRAVHAGERWQLLLRLRPPQATLNFEGVDTERNLLRDRIQALGTVIVSPLDQREAPAPPYSLLALRERLAHHISGAVDDAASGALLAALAVGETGEVTPGQWRVFNATGITHLVAISGMHVTAFAMLAMAAVRRLWRWVALRGLLHWPRERCAAVAGVVLASGYSLLAGFSVPTQRTLLMLAVWLALRESARASRASASLGAALAVVVLWDPFAVLAAGFWLSFLAVAAIIAIAGGQLQPGGTLRTAITVQWAVFVALLPATLAIFGSVSLAGLLVNVAAIPLFTWVLVPAALLATVLLLCLPQALATPLLKVVLGLGGAVAQWFAPWLARAADSSQALWVAAPPWWWFAGAALAVAWVLLPWPRAVRCGGVLVLLPLLWRDPRPSTDQLVMTVFDVGQPTAVLLRTRDHALLWGTGDSFGSDGVAVDRAVLPYLRAAAITALDALVLPRFDRDSGAGLTALSTGVAVGQVWGSAPEPMPPEISDCTVGAVLDWRPWQLYVMRDASGRCALRIEGQRQAMLLSDQLAAGVAASIPAGAAVLWVPHRGQGPALSAAQLEHSPQALRLVSVGHGSFAGPAWRALDRAAWQQHNPLQATARRGALELQLLPGSGVQLRAARDLHIGAWRGLVADGGNPAEP